VEQFETAAQPGEAFPAKLGFGQPRGELEILGAGGQRLARELDDQGVVGGLARTLPVTLRRVVILLPPP
jgi:hypothetical protein